MHLADAFIQSDFLYSLHFLHFFNQLLLSLEIKPMILVAIDFSCMNKHFSKYLHEGEQTMTECLLWTMYLKG